MFWERKLGANCGRISSPYHLARVIADIVNVALECHDYGAVSKLLETAITNPDKHRDTIKRLFNDKRHGALYMGHRDRTYLFIEWKDTSWGKQLGITAEAIGPNHVITIDKINEMLESRGYSLRRSRMRVDTPEVY